MKTCKYCGIECNGKKENDNCCSKFECKEKYKKEWYLKNPNYRKEYMKQWHLNNKTYNQDFRIKTGYSKIYYHDNKVDLLQKQKEKILYNENFKISRRLRCRIYFALKSKNILKSKYTMELLGCSIEQLKMYFQLQRKEIIDWSQMNLYDIHHIKECNTFDLKDIEQQKICFHYTNLQLVTIEEHKEIHRKQILIEVQCRT